MPADRQAEPTPAARRPTLKDVAAHAGVSVSTASLVFSGKGPVAPTTGDRVRAAAAALGYAGPDPLASSLRHGRTGTVAVLVEGSLSYAFRDPFALAVLDGVAAGLDEGGAAMLLVPGLAPDRSPSQLSASAFDAAIFPLCGPSDDPAVDTLAARGVPMVGAGGPEDARVVQLTSDERGSSAGAAQYLRDLGHERVAHVLMALEPGAHGGPVSPSDLETAAYRDTRHRALGFLDVYPEGRLVATAWPDVEAGEMAGRLLLDVPEGDRPTAVVAQSDLLAAGVVRVARELGMRVPEDLSVVGYDGVELPWLDTELTTVVQDGRAKGARLAGMARRLLAGEQVEDETCATTLRVGRTTARPRP